MITIENNLKQKFCKTFRCFSYLPVLEEGFLLNMPVNLSFTVFFSFFRSVSTSRLKSEPDGLTDTLGIRAFMRKNILDLR